jgi:hypothetical protein
MAAMAVTQIRRWIGMIRLLYYSQATPGIQDQEVRDILQTARRNNPGLGLTGVLVYGGGLFVQLLEGPEAAVLRQYVKILDDRRHGNCQIIHISPAEERMFQDWSMGAIEADPHEFQHLAELRSHRLEAVGAKVFSATLRQFVSILRGRAGSRRDA